MMRKTTPAQALQTREFKPQKFDSYHTVSTLLKCGCEVCWHDRQDAEDRYHHALEVGQYTAVRVATILGAASIITAWILK